MDARRTPEIERAKALARNESGGGFGLSPVAPTALHAERRSVTLSVIASGSNAAHFRCQPFVDLRVVTSMNDIISLTAAQEEGQMATAFQKPAKFQAFQARPRKNVDLDAAISKVNAQYKNTLAYLGK